MFMFKTNQPIKVIHLQKLATQSKFEWPTCDRNCQQFFQGEQEKLRSFDKARKLVLNIVCHCESCKLKD